MQGFRGKLGGNHAEVGMQGLGRGAEGGWKYGSEVWGLG